MTDPLLLVANWKMFGTRSTVLDFVSQIQPIHDFRLTAVLCFSYPYLGLDLNLPKGYFLGAQDCSAEEGYAKTGQVSAHMLSDIGCQYVILGHYERRFMESRADVEKKIEVSLDNGLHPIVCLGNRDQQNWRDEIITQLPKIQDRSIIIAYEPFYAIGQEIPAKSDDIGPILDFIQSKHPESCIIYGGAVQSESIETLLAIPILRGFLVGRASQNFTQWNQIISILL